MQGAFFLGADAAPEFELRDMVFPEKLRPHEVLIKTMACGVCGTDVHIWHGQKGSAEVTPPVVLGHEFSGVVAAAGPEVDTVSVGDHVTVDPNIYCGRCRPCRMGRKQNCEHLSALGVTLDGGFAQYALCPDTQCFRVDPALPFDVAAMAEPLACAVHGADRAGIVSGEAVLVIGGGAIGLMMLQLARLAGASRVLLSEPVAARRALAMQLGADGTIDPVSETLSDRLRALIGLDGADVVIECVGNTAAVAQAFRSVGPGGRIILFGVPAPVAEVPLPLYDVYAKELSIVGSRINPDTHRRAVELLCSGRVDVAPLITHTFPLARLDEAIQTQMGAESVKVMVHPQE